MFSSFGIAVIVCFVTGIAIIVGRGVRAGSDRTDGNIARVLYDAEQPEKSR